MSRPPNILLVVADQHRVQSLGASGNLEVDTPHLDRMAGEGTRYTNCVSVAPICAPYRGSLQTGLYPHQHGVTGNGQVPMPGVRGIGHDLARLGYETAYFGKCHWHGSPRPGYVPPEARLGWQHWLGHNRGHYNYDPPTFDSDGVLAHAFQGRYEPEWQTDQALAFMRAASRPWAVQLNLGPPHTATLGHLYAYPEVRERMRQLNDTWQFGIPEAELFARPESWFPQYLVAATVPRRFLERYDPDGLTLQPNVSHELAGLSRHYYREYYAQVSAVDEQVGRLLDAVQDDTIVVYTSDHGDQLGSHTRIPAGEQSGMPEQGTRVNKGRAKGRPLQNSYRVPLILWGTEHVPRGRVVDAPVNTLDFRPTVQRLAGAATDVDAIGGSLLPADVPARRTVFLGLEDWRASFDGRFFYAVAEREGKLHPYSLVDTEADPYDEQNLLDDQAFASRRKDLHTQLMRELRDVADPIGGTC